jgi:hypothetical protein
MSSLGSSRFSRYKMVDMVIIEFKDGGAISVLSLELTD